VFVDFENVQPKNVGLLNGGSFKIKVFLGANQAKLPLEMVRALHAFGPDAEYVQIDGSGRNALDFHIAYYIGRLAAEDPGAHFCVISKDTGFDPLIKHLKGKGISCQRSKSFADIAMVKPSDPRSSSERADAVITNLIKRQAGRPRTLKTLRSTIKALFANQLADEAVEGLIEELIGRGAVRIADGKVHYALPSA
jgi:hypothetical protein